MQTTTNDGTVVRDLAHDFSQQVEQDFRSAPGCRSGRPPRHFSPAIERALAILAGSDAVDFAGLSMDARMLLARYVRCVDARTPQQAVRVANQTLAIGLGVSARTVNKLKVRHRSVGRTGIHRRRWIGTSH